MGSSKHMSEEDFCIFSLKTHPLNPIRAQMAEKPLLMRRDQGTRRFSSPHLGSRGGAVTLPLHPAFLQPGNPQLCPEKLRLNLCCAGF